MRAILFFVLLSISIDLTRRGFKKNGKTDMVERYADRHDDDMGGFNRGRVLAVPNPIKKTEPRICDRFRCRDEQDIDRRQVQGQRALRIGGDEVSIPHD